MIGLWRSRGVGAAHPRPARVPRHRRAAVRRPTEPGQRSERRAREAPMAALVTGRGSQVLGMVATQAVSAEIYHVQTGSIYPDISPDNYGHPLIYTASIHEHSLRKHSSATQIGY